MSCYKLMVVDDRLDIHREDYCSVLGDSDWFDIVMEGDRTTVLKSINDHPVHAYVVDVNLWDSPDFHSIMGEISKHDAPIVLISNRWGEAKTVSALDKLPAAQRELVKGFMAWEEFSSHGEKRNDAVETTRLRIRQVIEEFYGRYRSLSESDAPVHILQISDLQCGDPDADPAAFLVQQKIASALRRESIGVDMVVVSGDQAYSGSPSEFRAAEEWLRDLCKYVWPSSDSSGRLFCVPGNHDNDLRVCCLGAYKYDFKSGLLAQAVNPVSGYTGLGAYYESARSLCNVASLHLDPSKAVIWSDWFATLGIRFVIVNSAGCATAGKPSHCDVPDSCMSRVTMEIDRHKTRFPGERLLTIVVSHHGFNDADANGYERQKEMEAFYESIGAHVLLYGHGHRLKHRQRSQKPLAGFIEVMCPTVRLNTKLRPDEYPRGFNVIKLHRHGGVIVKVEILAYSINGQTVRLEDEDVEYRSWTPRVV